MEQAIRALVSFRCQEGAALEKKFAEKIDNIERLMAEIEPFEKGRVEKIRQRIIDGLQQIPREKHAYYHRQVQVLYDAYTGTHELMDNGKANYLEVLTAQESLLNSQLSEAANIYKGAQAVIALYIALSGGTK